MECKNGCGAEVDALHMSDEGYCEECYDKIIDDILNLCVDIGWMDKNGNRL